MPPVERSSKARFFFVTAMALLASIIWSIWDEVAYRRPWKDYQAEFNRLEAESVRKSLAQENSKVAAEMARIETAIQKVGQELVRSEKLAAANSRLADIEANLEKVSLENKFTRSERDEAYYEYKHAIHEGKPGVAEKARFDKIQARAVKLGSAEGELLEQAAMAKETVEKIRKPLRKLEKERFKVGSRGEALERRLAAIERRVPAIHQVVIQGVELSNFNEPVNTVDRCQTCHRGADRAGFENFPAPFKTHPNRAVLLSKHPVETFGCVLCHGGQGKALNNLTKAHGIDLKTGEHLEFWEQPLLRGDDIQTNCLKCHTQRLQIPDAPVVSAGQRMFKELGCHGCHLLKGFENLPKVGPTLMKSTEKFRPEWMVGWVLEPRSYLPKTKMPYFAFKPEEATAITAYLLDVSKSLPASGPLKFKTGDNREQAVKNGRRLFESRGCLACHNIDGKGGDHGPNLSRVASKVKPDWLVNWVQNPRHYDPGTVMPNLKLPEKEVQDIAAYLLTKGKPAPANAKLAAQIEDPALIRRGRWLVENYGCYGCHDIEKTDKLGRLSVELTTFANKSPSELDFGDVTEIHEDWESWTFAKLKNPRIFSTDRISLRMPDFYLTDKEASALRTFLRRWNGHYMPERFVRHLNHREKALERGRRIAERFNCTGCHIIENKGGFVRQYYKDKNLAPPILNGEGAKVQPHWLYSFLKKPIPLRPSLNDGIWMPKFGLTDQEAADLVRYFIAQEKDIDLKTPYQFVDPYQFVTSENPNQAVRENSAVGKYIFQNFQCLECHQGFVEGIPLADLAPDLRMTKSRLRPAWIDQWLKDPQTLQPGTRMPTFFSGDQSPLETVWKGDANKQIAAIRDYLFHYDGGKGEVKGIPEGVITAAEEEDEEEEDEDEDDEDDEEEDN